MSDQILLTFRRPSPELLKLYFCRSVMSLVFFPLVFPALLIRYFTLNYYFDDQGITMRWGFFVRREVHLAYSRVQDIHVVSGLIQRWLGLADIMLQTASGNADAEMKIEGLHEYEYIRSFIYSKMRGYGADDTGNAPESEVCGAEDVLSGIRDELRETRVAVEHFIAAVAEERSHV